MKFSIKVRKTYVGNQKKTKLGHFYLKISFKMFFSGNVDSRFVRPASKFAPEDSYFWIENNKILAKVIFLKKNRHNIPMGT